MKLKPCPFCGCTNITWREISGPDGTIDAWLECWECNARGPSCDDNHEMWNIRSLDEWETHCNGNSEEE